MPVMGLCIILELDHTLGCLHTTYINARPDGAYLLEAINTGSIRVEMGLKSKCAKQWHLSKTL